MSKLKGDAVLEPKTLVPAPIVELEEQECPESETVPTLPRFRKISIAVCMMLVYFLGVR
jgi:hypothetical protein